MYKWCQGINALNRYLYVGDAKLRVADGLMWK
jgi:hypothetical protein